MSDSGYMTVWAILGIFVGLPCLGIFIWALVTGREKGPSWPARRDRDQRPRRGGPEEALKYPRQHKGKDRSAS